MHIETDRWPGWQIQSCSQAASIDSTRASQTPDTHQTLLENVSKCLFLHFYKDLVQAVVKWNTSTTIKNGDGLIFLLNFSLWKGLYYCWQRALLLKSCPAAPHPHPSGELWEKARRQKYNWIFQTTLLRLNPMAFSLLAMCETHGTNPP